MGHFWCPVAQSLSAWQLSGKSRLHPRGPKDKGDPVASGWQPEATGHLAVCVTAVITPRYPSSDEANPVSPGSCRWLRGVHTALPAAVDLAKMMWTETLLAPGMMQLFLSQWNLAGLRHRTRAQLWQVPYESYTLCEGPVNTGYYSCWCEIASPTELAQLPWASVSLWVNRSDSA